jgi:phospholipid/cholesterol/gamma-HCH transport system ATP-binding protein
MTPPEAYITVRDLTMAYGSSVIQRDLTFTVRRGDIFIIMGGSGSGKSTLLWHLIGLLPPVHGEVLIDGENLWAAAPEDQERIKRRFGVLFQNGGLWSSMTLAENVALPLETYTDLSPSETRRVVSLKLALVGLAGFEAFYPSELSGGMQKRAGLVHIPRMSATQSMGKFPLNPREAFHPVHVTAATWTTGRLPPPPGEACHRRSSATPGRYC